MPAKRIADNPPSSRFRIIFVATRRLPFAARSQEGVEREILKEDPGMELPEIARSSRRDNALIHSE